MSCGARRDTTYDLSAGSDTVFRREDGGVFRPGENTLLGTITDVIG
jgi:hypothetical protein